MACALALGEGDSLEDALAYRLARLGHQPRAEQTAKQGERLPFQGVAHLAAAGGAPGVNGLEIEHRPEAAGPRTQVPSAAHGGGQCSCWQRSELNYQPIVVGLICSHAA
jgi:hypothetical protein